MAGRCSVLTASPDVSGLTRLETFRLTPLIVGLHNARTRRGQSLRHTITLQIVTVDNEPVAFCHSAAMGTAVKYTLFSGVTQENKFSFEVAYFLIYNAVE